VSAPLATPVDTARLAFRPWVPSDAPVFWDLYRRDDVVRFLGATPQPCADLTDAQSRLERWTSRAVDGEGLWAIIRREDGAIIGTALLVSLLDADGSRSGAVEIGWHLHPDAWGRGYATEAGGALLALARAQGRPDVRALVWPENRRSAAVCARLGMARQGITGAWYGVELEEYRLATVVAVSMDGAHRFSKAAVESITLVEGLGVLGDAHAGATVQHRSRVARDPSQPNLRQVHLLGRAFLDEAREAGFAVGPGELGENVLTSGVALESLARDTVLCLGPQARVRVTGLRNPCVQIDDFRRGLLARAVGVDDAGGVVRRAGVMSVVLRGGVVRASDPILVEEPPGPVVPLDVV
jgi:RimJ/RimL family protein N-acetyltransferase